MSQPRLCHTTKYSLFTSNPKNRSVVKNSGVVLNKKVLANMKRDGYWPHAPIIAQRIGAQLQVIDGHNRLACAMHLGIPVYYLAIDADDAIHADPLEFSLSAKPWNLLDIIHARAADGDADCAEVLAYSEKTGISPGLAATILDGVVTPQLTYQSLRDGKYKVRDRERGGVVSNISAAAGKYVKWSTNTKFLSALLKVLIVPGFDPARLVEKIDKYPEVLAKQRSLDDYVDMIEAIYNRHVKKDVMPVAHQVRIVMKGRANGAWRDAG